MDILTGETETILRNDFSNNWNSAPKVEASDFLINGVLGETIGKRWDSVDRLIFNLTESRTLNLTMSDGLITELVRFDNLGNVTVVGSSEYGNFLSSDLTAGNYGLSFFTEGDRINYSVGADFI